MNSLKGKKATNDLESEGNNALRIVKLTNLQLNNLQNNTLTTLTVMSKWLMYWVLIWHVNRKRYSRLQYSSCALYEQWQNEMTVLNLAKKEMRRWGTSGTDICFNKYNAKWHAHLNPHHSRIRCSRGYPRMLAIKMLAAASRASYVLCCIGCGRVLESCSVVPKAG